jgi:enoyl-CoA hydratase
MSEQPHALVERDGHTLIVTMNRPEARNALSGEMLAIMSDAWDQVNADPGIRTAILTGAGGAFCAGADLKAMTRRHPGDSFEASDGGDGDGGGGGGGNDMSIIKPLLKGFLLTKPLIAAVEGAAVAGGTEILQGTDIRVAGESARFGVSEVRWGLFPLGGSAVRLRRQIPYTVAAEILLTGRHLSAAEAKEVGLIGQVVPDGQALERAKEIAAAIAANGPLAVQAVLRTLRETECLPEEQAFKIDGRIGMEVFRSADAKEGPRAFMEKRPAQFQGR